MKLKNWVLPALSLLCIVSVSLVITRAAAAQELSGPAAVSALRQGGYVIVMRHTSSPREVPDRKSANADNVTPERQLDEAGRTSATAMGKAMRDLKIPVGDVLSSPTYRAMETARLAEFSNPRPTPELGDGGQSMQGVTETQGTWLKEKVAQAPKGTNTIMITHMPNLSRAFPQVSGVADGEALIFHPDGKGAAPLVGRIKIEQWPGMRP